MIRTGSEQGITFIDLVVVAALGATLAVLALPSVQQSWNYYHLSSSAQQLASELNLARVMAMSRNAVYELRLDAERGTFQIIDPRDPDNPPRQLKALSGGISFGRLPEEPILFFSRGHARGGILQLQDPHGHSVELEVQGSGLVRLKEVKSGEGN